MRAHEHLANGTLIAKQPDAGPLQLATTAEEVTSMERGEGGGGDYLGATLNKRASGVVA